MKNPKQQSILRCLSENKLIFEDQRHLHEYELGHEVEPLAGKLFTESDEFFEGVEKEAYDNGMDF